MAIVEFRGGPLTVRYFMNKTKRDLAHRILPSSPSLGEIDKLISENDKYALARMAYDAEMARLPEGE